MRDTSLRKRLKTKRMSAANLAVPCGVSCGHMAAVFNGSRRPSPRLAAKIEAITGIPLRTLLGLDAPEAAEGRK